MKHFALYIGLAVALVVSCSTKENDIQTPQQDDVIYYASFEEPMGVDTKVYANEDLHLRWTADDRVSIFGKNTYNQQYKFIGETGDNSGGFNKVDGAEYVTGNPISHTVSVYPYQEGTKISESETITLTLPAEQHYAENTFGLGANTMVSVSNDNVLMYKNVGGYFVLKLYGEGVTVSSITLKGNNNEKLAGKASISMSVDGIPSVSMSSETTTEITLKCQVPVLLGATAEESTQFWVVVPPMTFEKGFTITVTGINGGVFTKSTSSRFEIKRNNLSRMSALKVDISEPDPEGLVDMGLSVKWASCNLGAMSPEQYGDYYSWGETETKNSYGPNDYKWYKVDVDTWKYTKYVTSPSWGYEGYSDGLTVLEPEDDAAHVILGEGFRIPTENEWRELLNTDNCDWNWIELSGVNGYQVTSKKNGNSIFLPAAGFRSSGTSYSLAGNEGDYWSSSLGSYNPYYVGITSGGASIGSGWNCRYYGFSIRPVFLRPIHVQSISLNPKEVSIVVGKTVSLQVCFLPENAHNQNVKWDSSDETIAIVDNSGIITGRSVGSCVITVKSLDSGVTDSCVVTVVSGSEEMVDMGLSVKWASCNLGALKPEDIGNQYQWGDSSPKNGYFNWSNYIWCNGDNHSLTKYCCDSNYGYKGFVDNKVELEPNDDAAFISLGSKWRMPTVEEVKELVDNCTWEYDNDNRGLYAISQINGERLFFPVGPSSYWETYLSSSLYADYTYYKDGDLQIKALCLYVDISEYFKKGWLALANRAGRNLIRPVYGDKARVPVSHISLDRTELTIPVERTKTIVATVQPDNATDKVVIWSSDNPMIATVSAGEITGISTGNCIISATSHDGGLVATCQVTVVPKSDPSFYSSTDFSKDGEVVLLHKATVGKGVNLILLGDGFVDTDMADGGKYDQKMIAAMEQFFSYEPYKSFKDRFNLYYVRVVSTNSVYGSEQSDRSFSYEVDGRVYFRQSLCYEYAKRVPNPYSQPMKIAVLFNINGTFARSFCSMNIGTGEACCYILGAEENIINHELGGHGFAFLADEYVEYSGTFSEQSLLDQRYENYGYGANVDYHDTPSTVRWSRLLNDSRYAQEGLGLYEGAYLYPYGIYRPTENSIMRNHYLSTGKAFNAPSREQIYKTIMRYSVGDNWVYDYETFVNADAAGREQAAKVFNSSTGFSAVAKQQALKHQSESHMPPVITDRRVKEIEVDKRGNVTIIK